MSGCQLDQASGLPACFLQIRQDSALSAESAKLAKPRHPQYPVGGLVYNPSNCVFFACHPPTRAVLTS